MILPWKNYLETNEVSFVTPDGVKYIGYPNSKLYILKISSDGVETQIYDTPWELEKKYLSDTYSDIYGVYESCTFEELEPDDDKQCMFGKTPEGLYLDRLQRPEYVMDHLMTHTFFLKEGFGKLHTPDGGKTVFKTDWCSRLDDMYNVMKCDVFPDNPGWKTIDLADVNSILMKQAPDLTISDKNDLLHKLETHTMPMPVSNKGEILNNWIIK